MYNALFFSSTAFIILLPYGRNDLINNILFGYVFRMYQIIGMPITLFIKRPVLGVQNWPGEGLRQGRLSSLSACPFALMAVPLAVLDVYLSS
jgi:hypothetical protein